MNCEEFRVMLDNYANLTDEEKLGLAAHADECPNCKAELDFLLSVINSVNTLPKIEPSADFLDRLNKRIDAEEKGGKKIWKAFKRYSVEYSGIAACLLLAACIGINGKILGDKMMYHDDGAAVAYEVTHNNKAADEQKYGTAQVPMPVVSASPEPAGSVAILPKVSAEPKASSSIEKDYGGVRDNGTAVSRKNPQKSYTNGRSVGNSVSTSGITGNAAAGGFTSHSWTAPSDENAAKPASAQTEDTIVDSGSTSMISDNFGGKEDETSAAEAIKPNSTAVPKAYENVQTAADDDKTELRISYGSEENKEDLMNNNETSNDSITAKETQKPNVHSSSGSSVSGGSSQAKPTEKPEEDKPAPTRRPDYKPGSSGSGSSGGSGSSSSTPSGGMPQPGAPSASGGTDGDTDNSDEENLPPEDEPSDDETGEAVIEISYTDEEQLEAVKDILANYTLYMEGGAYVVDGESINALASEIRSVVDRCYLKIYSKGSVISVTLVY